MQHTFTLPGAAVLSEPAAPLILDFDLTTEGQLQQSVYGGNPTPVLDSEGNPILVFFDKATQQAFARVATFNPNDGGADAAAIAAQGAIPNFSGKPSQWGYFVPVVGLLIPAAGHAVATDTAAALAAHTLAEG